MNVDLVVTSIEVFKVLGSLGAIVAAIALTSRLWKNAARDKMIEYLKTSLDTERGLSTSANEARERLAAEAIELARKTKDCEVENAALKLRPDLGSIQNMLKEQGAVFKAISDSLVGHSRSDAEIFIKINLSLEKLSNLLVERTPKISRISDNLDEVLHRIPSK